MRMREFDLDLLRMASCWTTTTASGSEENEEVVEYYVQCRIELARRHLEYKIIKNMFA